MAPVPFLSLSPEAHLVLPSLISHHLFQQNELAKTKSVGVIGSGKNCGCECYVGMTEMRLF